MLSFKVWRGKNLETRILYPARYHLNVSLKYSQALKVSKSLPKTFFNKSNKIIHTIGINKWTSPDDSHKYFFNLSDASTLFFGGISRMEFFEGSHSGVCMLFCRNLEGCISAFVTVLSFLLSLQITWEHNIYFSIPRSTCHRVLYMVGIH